jgi:uncharacterized membrane protein
VSPTTARSGRSGSGRTGRVAGSGGSSSGPASSACGRSASRTSASRSTAGTRRAGAVQSEASSEPDAGPLVATDRRRPGAPSLSGAASTQKTAARASANADLPGLLASIAARPRLAALLGALSISFSGIFYRWAEVSPSTGTFYRCLFGLPFLAAVAYLERRKFGPLPRATLRLALIAGIFFAGDLTFWHHAIEFVGAGLATVLGNLQVLIVALVAWAVFGERPPRSVDLRPRHGRRSHHVPAARVRRHDGGFARSRASGHRHRR